jgi:hypothetical protein
MQQRALADLRTGRDAALQGMHQLIKEERDTVFDFLGR